MHFCGGYSYKRFKLAQLLGQLGVFHIYGRRLEDAQGGQNTLDPRPAASPEANAQVEADVLPGATRANVFIPQARPGPGRNRTWSPQPGEFKRLAQGTQNTPYKRYGGA